MRGHFSSSDRSVWRAPSRFSMTSLFQYGSRGNREPIDRCRAARLRRAPSVGRRRVRQLSPFTTNKVDVIPIDGLLADEYEAAELPAANACPQREFCWRAGTPQRTGTLGAPIFLAVQRYILLIKALALSDPLPARGARETARILPLPPVTRVAFLLRSGPDTPAIAGHAA